MRVLLPSGDRIEPEQSRMISRLRAATAFPGFVSATICRPLVVTWPNEPASPITAHMVGACGAPIVVIWLWSAFHDPFCAWFASKYLTPLMNDDELMLTPACLNAYSPWPVANGPASLKFSHSRPPPLGCCSLISCSTSC